MKLPRHLIHQVILTLRDIFVKKVPAEVAVNQAVRQHPKWGGRDRKFFAENVYGIVRWRRWFWHLAGLPAEDCENPEAHDEARLWRVWAAYWLAGGVPDQAEAASADENDDDASEARTLPDWPEVAAVSAESVAQRAQVNVPAAVRDSWPDWLDARLAAELGDAWPALRVVLNRPAEVFLRTNPLRAKKALVQLRLMNEGVLTAEVPGLPHALRLRHRAKAVTVPAFKAGWFEVQDAASQQIAPLLHPQPGQTIVDLCAGAGGKTLHLAALMNNDGQLHAFDVHGAKLAELRRRANRAGATIIKTRVLPENTQAAAAALAPLAGSVDGVLLDVPCSGLGVLRRHPDTKWRLTEADLARLLPLQASLLRLGSSLVRPGGALVYATCSILPSENAHQIHAFLAEGENRRHWALEEEIFFDPVTLGFDGFYAARLRRLNAAEVDCKMP